MKPFQPRTGGAEAGIQNAIVSMLRTYGWNVMATHGNMFQRGFPDLFASHQKWGMRWIEVKNPKGWRFTPAQKEAFPKMIENGAPIWILMSATDDSYMLLFKAANCRDYL